ncbi:MAG: transporter substrate-binding domain-containing protein [Verrucomicrobiota bacterium]|nr:transporter substrate-binding domain-containing protein [Verrucomicrobiota bacterium]
MIARWFLALFSLLFSFSAFADGGKLIVGTTSGYAPYVSLNEKGDYEGFDIDLARLVAERLNRKLVLQDLGSMPSLLVALKKNKIDAIIWAMSITEDRRKEMEMIYYQGEIITTMPFIFWKEAPKGVAKIEDLGKVPNCKICVEAGSYQDTVLQKHPSLKLRFLDKISDGLMEVKYGKALSATVDNSLIPRIQSQYPELKVLYLPLAENERNLGNGVCINKENKQLITQVSKVVADLTKEGKIAELEKKWNLGSN